MKFWKSYSYSILLLIQHQLFRAGYPRASALPCHHHTRTSFRPDSLPLCLLCCNQVGWLFAIEYCNIMWWRLLSDKSRRRPIWRCLSKGEKTEAPHLWRNETKQIWRGRDWTEKQSRKEELEMSYLDLDTQPNLHFQPWRTNSNSVINRFLRIDINYIELYQFISTVDLMRY